jgi:hypothetical protein
MRYNNITKAQARGWTWNQVCSRLPWGKQQRSQQRVYVLIGDTTAELQTGLSKGFSPFNIIGVDTKKKNVQMWRDVGGLAIQGSMDLVVTLSKVRPDAVLCDFCGGMTKQNFHTFWMCYMHLNRPGVISLNMLRGRDDIDSFRNELNTAAICQGLGLNEKNRGHLMYAKMLIDSFYFESTIQEYFGNDVDGFMGFASAISKHLAPKFYNYRSKDGGKQYFDTLVLSLPGHAPEEFTRPKELDQNASDYRTKRHNCEEVPKIKRRLAALEAVRTMAIQKNGGRMFRPGDYE